MSLTVSDDRFEAMLAGDEIELSAELSDEAIGKMRYNRDREFSFPRWNYSMASRSWKSTKPIHDRRGRLTDAGKDSGWGWLAVTEIKRNKLKSSASQRQTCSR